MENDLFFEFTSYVIDPDRKTLRFMYRTGYSENPLTFTEEIILPDPIGKIPSELLDLCLKNLHLILGISYWKLYCPQSIKILSLDLSKEQSFFWNTVYTKGLGQFFYENKIDYRNRINFPYKEDARVNPQVLELKKRALTGVGGGKDSAYLAELLKQGTVPFKGYVVYSNKVPDVISEMARLEEVDLFKVRRVIDPALFDLNLKKTVYNGHVPISAIHAFIALLLAVSYDYRQIITANEKSADFGNVNYLGTTINHQWSKSEEFEELFQDYIHTYITPSVHYFSLLRSLTELQIVEQFVKYEKYLPVFTSCNRNFLIQKSSTNRKWCGECPKCLFVFILLSAFLDENRVMEIFHKNLFASPELGDTYRELLGIKGVKPFECVGTPEEVREASRLIKDKGKYKNTPLMTIFEKESL